MDKTILNIFKGISLVLIALAVLFQIIVLIKGEEGVKEGSVLNNYALVAYIALGIAVFLALLFPVIFMIQNPKNALHMINGNHRMNFLNNVSEEF